MLFWVLQGRHEPGHLAGGPPEEGDEQHPDHAGSGAAPPRHGGPGVRGGVSWDGANASRPHGGADPREQTGQSGGQRSGRGTSVAPGLSRRFRKEIIRLFPRGKGFWTPDLLEDEGR